MPKDTIRRVSTKKGAFATITNKLMTDETLSTDARFLMLVIMNNNPDCWELNFNYYLKNFSWSKPRMKKAKEELISKGYLTQQKISTGINFQYKYLIDENGKLREENNLQQEQNMPLVFTGETTQSGFKVAKYIANNTGEQMTSMGETKEIISHHDLLKHFKENFPDYAGYDLLDFKEKLKYKLVSTYNDVNKYIETNKIPV